MKHSVLDWLLAKTVRSLRVDTQGQSDLHAMAVDTLYEAAVGRSGIMLPNGHTVRFTGRAQKERPMRDLPYRPDLTAEIEERGCFVFEVCVGNRKGLDYHTALSKAGICGVELFVRPDDVFQQIEELRDAIVISTLVTGALRQVMLTGTKDNRQWLGCNDTATAQLQLDTK